MATLYYQIAPTDSSAGSGSQFKTGQAGSMSFTTSGAGLKTTGATQTDVSSHAVITEVTVGIYQIAYDPEANGEASGVLDCGSGFSVNSDRFLPVSLTRDSGRLQAAIAANGHVNEVTLVDTLTTAPAVTLATSQPNYAPATAAALATLSTTLGTDITTLAGLIGTPAQASQIPANFTTACFASAGVFSTGALANAPAGGGGGGGALSSNGLDSVVVETGVNARQALSAILAACGGIVSGAGTGTVAIKGGNVSTTRITATTDSSGNRSSVTLSLPT